MESPDCFLVFLRMEQHGVPAGEKVVQAAKSAEREASEDKDPRWPPEGVTLEWQMGKGSEEGWVITNHHHHQAAPQLTHLQSHQWNVECWNTRNIM